MTVRPTQKTIAKLTGLAITTVSRALLGDPKIAQATRARVEKVANEIGYVPDRSAQRLRTGKTHMICLILDPHNEMLGFGNSLISGVTQTLSGTDYHLTVMPHFERDKQQDPVHYVVRNNLADGIIFSRTQPFDERVRYLMEHKVPFATHGRTDFATAHAYVDYDNRAFAYEAAMRLIAKGRTRLSIVLPPKHFSFYQHLHYGFMQAVRQTGVDYVIPEEITLDSTRDEIAEWAAKIGTTAAAPDGFVCPGEASYFAVFGGYRSIFKAPGEEFDAVVKCSTGILSQIDPSIDRIIEDIEEAGALLGEHVLSLIHHPTMDPHQTMQFPRLQFAGARASEGV